MKTNIMKYTFFIIVILMIGLAIYFLYKDGKKEVYGVKNQNININMAKELNIGINKFDTINPILSSNRDIQYINKLIFSPLIDISYNFKIENNLVQEFSKINDVTYIAKLKEDVYWHDGEKFTSEDVIFTINNLKFKDINSIYKENVENIQEVQKIDDYTIKIILNNEVNFFEYMMCIPIIAKHSYDENTLESTTNIPVGTGKFKIEDIKNDKIVIVKSDTQSESKTTKINLILNENAKDLYIALSKNQIDLMVTDNLEYEEYIGNLGYNVSMCCNRNFDYLVLNNENLILKDKEVRKAINYAIDKNIINYNIYNSKYKLSSFPLDYGSYLYSEDEKNDYDINKAKSILLENGWDLKNNILRKNGKALKIRLLVNKENEKRIQVAKSIKEQLQELGVLIDIIAVDNLQINNYIKYKNYDMILTGNIISNSPDLETYFGDNNLSNFKNEEINEIMDEIKDVDNQEDFLKQKYKRIEEIYIEEMPFISLYFNNLFVLYNKNLKGDLNGNWYNIYYNIDNWYKIK